MNLKELKDIVNRFSDKEAEHLNVVIELEDNDPDVLSCENIVSAKQGFDWEISNFILTSQNPVVIDKSNEQMVKRQKFIRVINDVTICRCPKCNVDIDIIDRFCRNCGQSF